MRIGIDARPLAHPNSGIGRYTSIIVNELRDRSFDIRLYGASRKFSPKRAAIATQISSALQAQLTFGSKAERDKVDVYWSPRHHLPFQNVSIPTVVTIHDLVWKHCPESMSYGRAKWDKVLTSMAIRKASAIVAISDFTASDIRNTFPMHSRKLQVVSPAPTVTAERADALPATLAPANTPFILFVGTNEPRKNMDRVIGAFQSLTTKNHALVLITNAGWKQSKTLELATQEGRIIKLSGVNDRELASLYLASDFLVMPSLYEGFGLPVAEAISFGKPVIVSQNSSMSEIAGQAALSVNPLSQKDISEAMMKLIEDRGVYQRLAAEALLEAKKYSWNSTVDQLVRVFKSVATSN